MTESLEDLEKAGDDWKTLEMTESLEMILETF